MEISQGGWVKIIYISANVIFYLATLILQLLLVVEVCLFNRNATANISDSAGKLQNKEKANTTVRTFALDFTSHTHVYTAWRNSKQWAKTIFWFPKGHQSLNWNFSIHCKILFIPLIFEGNLGNWGEGIWSIKPKHSYWVSETWLILPYLFPQRKYLIKYESRPYVKKEKIGHCDGSSENQQLITRYFIIKQR